MDKPIDPYEPSTDVASLRRRLGDLHDIRTLVLSGPTPSVSALSTLDQLISEIGLVLQRLDPSGRSHPQPPHAAQAAE